MGAECKTVFISFKLPNLKEKNTYHYSKSITQIDERRVQAFSRVIFNNKHFRQYYQSLISYFVLNSDTVFDDPHFPLKGQRISKLYDFKRKDMRLCDPQNKNGLAVFQQLDIEFAYLSTVVYFMCQNKQFLRNRVLLTNEINSNQIYAFRFFSNGQQHCVIIDDRIPVYRDDRLEYSQIKSKQIWPLLLQKAWCKQIGDYDKARGLSPEQTFQQITGIPTYSYLIHETNIEDLHNIMTQFSRMGYWLCVVAKKQTGVLKNNQVFIIDRVDQEFILLISPFTNFKSPEYQQSRKGTLRLNYLQFVQYFEFLIIGFYKKGYVPISQNLTSKKRQQKLYQLYINKSQQISIRFTQFYQGYLNDTQKVNYEYSPLTTFQIYDKNYNLLNFCQGCQRLYAGAHSSYFTNNIFHLLQEGKYYLRFQIEWEYQEIINQGNIVIYASQGNVQIAPMDISDQKQKIKQLHINSLKLPNSVVIQGQSQLYQLRFLQKKNQLLISIQNKSEELLRLQLDFHKSQNFRTRYEKLQVNKKIVVNLLPKQIKIVEILPQQLKKEFRIQPFAIKKLPNPQ